jgi:hypothetical protein
MSDDRRIATLTCKRVDCVIHTKGMEVPAGSLEHEAAKSATWRCPNCGNIGPANIHIRPAR